MNLDLFGGKSKLSKKPKLDTIEDRIAAYEIGIIDELTPKELEIRDRWSGLWAMLVNFHSPTQAVKAHVKKCEQSMRKISERTAWDDYRKCTLLWGNLMETTKKAKRILVEEYAHKTFQMAVHNKDIKGMNMAVANLIKINNLDRPDAEITDGAGGGNAYFMAIYTKGAEKPKIISLDDMNNIPAEQYQELLEAVEDQEITDVEMHELMKSEGLDGSKAS